METAIKVGSVISKDSAEHVAKTVERIFRVGYATHMDQETIRQALHAMSESFSINGLTIAGATINGDKVVNQ